VIGLAHPDGSESRVPRNPIGLSVTPVSYRLAPPPLGSANDGHVPFWDAPTTTH